MQWQERSQPSDKLPLSISSLSSEQRCVAANHGNSDIGVGEAVFRFQCMSCHTEDGYRSMRKLLGSRDEDAIMSLLSILRETDPKKTADTAGSVSPLPAVSFP